MKNTMQVLINNAMKEATKKYYVVEVVGKDRHGNEIKRRVSANYELVNKAEVERRRMWKLDGGKYVVETYSAN